MPPYSFLFNRRLDLGLLVSAIAEGAMCGLLAVAEPIVAGFFHFESNWPAGRFRLLIKN